MSSPSSPSSFKDERRITLRRHQMDDVVIERKLVCHVAWWFVIVTQEMLGMDAAMLYKPKPNISKLRRGIYRRQELRLRENRYDWFRDKSAYFIKSWILYAISKCYLLFYIQMFHTRYRYSRVTEGGRMYLRDHYANASPATHSSQQLEWIESSKRVMEFGEFIGNPLNMALGLSIFLYPNIAMNIFSTLIFFFFLHKRRPFDFVHINLVIEPEMEIKRVDLIILDTLNYYYGQVEEKLSLLKSHRCCQFGRNLVQLENLINLRGQLNLLSGDIRSIRPKMFWPEHHTNHCKMIMKLVYYPVIICILPAVFLPAEFFKTGIRGRCALLRLPEVDCLSKNVSSFSDIITSAELVVLMILIGWIFVTLIIIIIGAILAQRVSVNDVGQDLKKALHDLRLFNSFGENPNKQQMIFVLRNRINYQLLRTIIKLLVTEIELRRSSKFLSRILNIYLSVLGFALITALLASKVDSNYILLRNLTIGWLLIWMNVVLVFCANYKSNANKMDRTFWSLVSELIRREAARQRPYNGQLIGLTLFKMSGTRSLNATNNSVRFFGLMIINYQKLMELNFIFFSLVVLLKAY